MFRQIAEKMKNEVSCHSVLTSIDMFCDVQMLMTKTVIFVCIKTKNFTLQ